MLYFSVLRACCIAALCLGQAYSAAGAGPQAADSASEDPIARFSEVNAWWNHRILYEHSRSATGYVWSTPTELLHRGAGDCSDYAIAKYFSLRDLGVPADRLRLAYAFVLFGGAGDQWRPHLVLVVLQQPGEPRGSESPDEGVVILDNLVDEVRPLSRRPDLRIVFSFDAEALWVGLDRGPPPRASRQVLAWAQVLDRMELAQRTARSWGLEAPDRVPGHAADAGS